MVGACDPRKETARSLAEMMIGETCSRRVRDIAATGPVRLVGQRPVAAPATDPFGVDLADITFEVRGGEILGIAGVAGNGQIELMEALIGERPRGRPDAIAIDGKPAGRLPPVARRRLGVAFVPEERLGHGAVPTMSLWENALLSAADAKQSDAARL